METTRRGFLGLMAASVAAVAVNAATPVLHGQKAVEAAYGPVAARKKLMGRHMSQYDLINDCMRHRLDVAVGGAQYGVDFLMYLGMVEAEPIEQALEVLVAHIQQEHGEAFDIELKHFDPNDPEAYTFLPKIGQ